VSHVDELVHSVVGRVSVTHAPWLQYSPAAHPPDAEQAAVQVPSTQYGVDPLHVALDVQPVADGKHAPLVQVVPVAQGVAGQAATH
jgi:hypothetical protein